MIVVELSIWFCIYGIESYLFLIFPSYSLSKLYLFIKTTDKNSMYWVSKVVWNYIKVNLLITPN